jgi:nucleotide-binding universal stress UspA family protein
MSSVGTVVYEVRQKLQGAPMFQHILIATDGSLLSDSALDKALDFAREAGAKVTVVTATEPFAVFSADSTQLAQTKAGYEKHIKAEAARYLAEAERKAKTLGVQCDVIQVEQQHPYRAIIDAAKKHGCDLIAMASHGRRGVSALVLGSETTKVLTHSSVPVLVYR